MQTLHDLKPFCERDTVREIDSAIELDVGDDDVEVLASANHDPRLLSEPYHWCDYHCRRCPLAGECKLAKSDRGSFANILEELEDVLDCAVQQITEELARSGVPPEAPSEVALATVTALEGRRLVRLARTVNLRVVDAVQAGLLPSVQISVDAIRLAGKTARITGDGYAPSPEDADDSPVPGDLFANIMHIEQLVGSMEEQMIGLPPVAAATAARSAIADYKRCFAGWAARVPADFRVRLAELVRLGHAPSPFATIEPRVRKNRDER